MSDERREAHERLTREIAHAVLHLIDPEETEPRSTVFDHLFGAYQDAKQLVEAEAAPEFDAGTCEHAHTECPEECEECEHYPG